MKISDQQVESLLAMLAKTREQELDCGGCMRYLAEFAETTLAGLSIPEGLRCIDEHLQSCGECREEFEALKLAIGNETWSR